MPVCSRSVWHTIGEEHRNLRVDHAPVLPPAGQFFRDVHHGQIQHLEQAVIRRKDRFRLRHLSELPVEAFNNIGGVDQPAHPRLISAKLIPVSLFFDMRYT